MSPDGGIRRPLAITQRSLSHHRVLSRFHPKDFQQAIDEMVEPECVYTHKYAVIMRKTTCVLVL